jgi:hypothetical protein
LLRRHTVWFAKGEFDKALKDFEESLRIDPHHAHAFIGQGMATHGKRKLEESEHESRGEDGSEP